MFARLPTGHRGARRSRRGLAGTALAGVGALALTAGCYQPNNTGMLAALRNCETGGNYQMHTWVGGVEYGGGYGFNVAIWRAQGHSPAPQYAPAWLQDQVELADIGQLGVHQSNPGCAAKLGL